MCDDRDARARAFSLIAINGVLIISMYVTKIYPFRLTMSVA